MDQHPRAQPNKNKSLKQTICLYSTNQHLKQTTRFQSTIQHRKHSQARPNQTPGTSPRQGRTLAIEVPRWADVTGGRAASGPVGAVAAER